MAEEVGLKKGLQRVSPSLSRVVYHDMQVTCVLKNEGKQQQGRNLFTS